MFVRAVSDQLHVPQAGLRPVGVGAGGAGLVYGREERVAFEGSTGWNFRDRSRWIGGEGEGVDKDVLVATAAALGGDDMRVVGSGDFVDYADKAFVPALFVVVWVCDSVFLADILYGLIISAGGVGEAGFGVGDAREIEGHYELWDDNFELRERFDTASTAEGFSAEVGAIG